MFILPYYRDALLQVIPNGGLGCEVGVFRADFSKKLLAGLQPEELLLVDPWVLQDLDVYTDPTNDSMEEMESRYQDVQQWADTEDRVTVVRGFSLDAAAEFVAAGHKKLFWVYIDAIHSYEACLEDLRAWSECVADDGIIMGHDYADNPVSRKFGFNVPRAVGEFCDESEWELLAITHEAYPTFVLVKDPSTRQGLMEQFAATSTCLTVVDSDIGNVRLHQEFIPIKEADGNLVYLTIPDGSPASIMCISRLDTPTGD